MRARSRDHALTHHLNQSGALTSWQTTPNLLLTFTPAECDAAGYRYQRRKCPPINSHNEWAWLLLILRCSFSQFKKPVPRPSPLFSLYLWQLGGYVPARYLFADRSHRILSQHCQAVIENPTLEARNLRDLAIISWDPWGHWGLRLGPSVFGRLQTLQRNWG